MAVTHEQAARWTEQQWMGNVHQVKVSSGGSVGVLFVWAGSSPIDKPDLAGPPQFVVKPVGSGGASTRMAEAVLRKVANTAVPDSIEIKPGTDGFRGVMFWVGTLLRKGNAAMVEKGAHYKSAAAFMLQKNVVAIGFKEMNDTYKASPDALQRMVSDDLFMSNLGRLTAADIVLGNGDRVTNGNLGNIMFHPVSGQLMAIDSATILASYDRILEGSRNPDSVLYLRGCMTAPNDTTADFALGIAEGSQVAAPGRAQIDQAAQRVRDQKVPAPVQASVAPIQLLEKGRHGELFTRFQEELQGRIELAKGAIKEPTDYQWRKARAAFLLGLDEGLRACDDLLGGLSFFRRHFMKSPSWKQLKKDWKDVGYSGEDANLSWYNLVVRRDIYIQLRRGKPMSEAIRHAQAVAARKRGKMFDAHGAQRRVG